MPARKETFAYVWEFHVRKKHLRSFRKIYGPTGDWVRLFRKAKGYTRTELLNDISHPQHSITVDYWKSLKHHRTFCDRHGEEIYRLDARCRRLTIHERFLGSFDMKPHR